jgi:hypothetical protein
MSNTAQKPDINSFAQTLSVRDSFLWMSKQVEKTSPLTTALGLAAADDAAILEIARHTGANQYPSVMFHTVVRYLLFKYPHEKLAAYYPSMTARPLPTDEAFPVFREFSIRHAEEIKALISSRTLQMTAAERAAPLLWALQHLAIIEQAPLNLIEIGCSAGLLLQFDRYCYDFGAAGTWGDPASPVTIRSDIRGAVPALPKTFPAITRRVGIDLNPLRADDPDTQHWVLAGIHPEWLDVLRSLKRALDAAASNPLDIVKGDALIEMPRIAAAMTGPLCVYHSHCLYQWPEVARDALEKSLQALSHERLIHRISIESTGLAPPEILHMQYRGGELIASTRLGTCENFGLWTELA